MESPHTREEHFAELLDKIMASLNVTPFPSEEVKTIVGAYVLDIDKAIHDAREQFAEEVKKEARLILKPINCKRKYDREMAKYFNGACLEILNIMDQLLTTHKGGN